MHTVNFLKLQNYDTKEVLNLKNGHCVVRKIELNFNDTSTTHKITNASYYAYSEVLDPYEIEIEFFTKYENDYNVKRFINKRNATFLLQINQNDRVYSIFVKKGDQESSVDFGIKKSYKITLMGVSRFFETVLLNPKPEISENSRYRIGKYTEDTYQGVDVNIEATVSFLNNGDTSSYLQIDAFGTGKTFELYINRELKTFTTETINTNDIFFYSNIPTQKTLEIDNIRKINILPIDNVNFEFEIPVGVNTIEVRGLTNIKLTLLKGVNII